MARTAASGFNGNGIGTDPPEVFPLILHQGGAGGGDICHISAVVAGAASVRTKTER